MTDGPAGSVKEIWRFPVKSMKGERLTEVAVTSQGLVGDRAYALVDVETGKVASAKSVRLFPSLLACTASFVEPPERDADAPAVRITFQDGASVTSDAGDADKVLSAHFKRDVRLASAAPEDFTIDQYHPDIEGADPAGHRDALVESKLGAALFAQIGAPSPVAAGAFFDVFPVSVITTSTLAQLNALEAASRFDVRRFRMNVIVNSAGDGFVENGWINRPLAIGDVRLHVAMPDPRCVMTTLAQDELPADTEVLRALVRHNRLDLGPMGSYPCAGVYAVVAAPGAIAAVSGVLATTPRGDDD